MLEENVVRRRKKGPSKVYRDRYGHTPLSPREAIPWSARRLIVGTGVSGQLPIMPEMRVFSSYMSNLNSQANRDREAAKVPKRATIVYATSWLDNKQGASGADLSIGLGDMQGFMEAVHALDIWPVGTRR
jgi:hypothetical protein